MARKPLRVYHGPMNIAGIAQFLSELERKEGLQSEAIVFEAKSVFKNIKSMGLERSGLKRRLYPIWFFLRSLARYDVYHFYFGISFLMFGIDLPILRLFGKKVIMTYCGSEVRLMQEVEAVRNPFFESIDFGRQHKVGKSAFSRWWRRQVNFRYSAAEFDQRKITMMRRNNRWVHRFFVIRDCFAHVKNYVDNDKIWLDIPVNHISIKLNPELPPPVKNEKLRIVHAPSNPGVKGTKFLEDALNQLEAEGYQFEYVRMTGMPFDQVQAEFANADIIVDQLLLGAFGSVTIEGMSYGKPVVVFVLDELIDQFFQGMPLWNANPDTIKDRLQILMDDRQKREEIGKAGFEYVHRMFDPATVGPRVKAVYESLYPKTA